MDMGFLKWMDQLYPKKGVYIKVDEAPPEKIGSEKKLLTIEAHPIHKILNIFWKLSHNRVPGHQSVSNIIKGTEKGYT